MERGWSATSHVLDNLKADSYPGDPFAAAVRATRMPMIITDPRHFDNPIVFANDSFLKLTGYTRMEVTGRNCRFLQGPDTDPEAIDRLREAIRQEVDVRVDLLNYRKDGSTFYNALYVGPVRERRGPGRLLLRLAARLSAHYALTAEIARLKREPPDRPRRASSALAGARRPDPRSPSRRSGVARLRASSGSRSARGPAGRARAAPRRARARSARPAPG